MDVDFAVNDTDRVVENSEHDKKLLIKHSRFQCPLAESLIGLLLLGTLLKINDASISTFLLCGLIVEQIVALSGEEIPKSRNVCHSTGVWLIALLPAILSYHDARAALNLIGGSLGTAILLFIVSTPRIKSLMYISLWLISARAVHLDLSLEFFLVFLFIFFVSTNLIYNYPFTFTLWEAVLIAQICFIFNTNTTAFIIPMLLIYAVVRFGLSPSRETCFMLSVSAAWLISILNEFAFQLITDGALSDPITSVDYDIGSFMRGLFSPMNILLVVTIWLPSCIMAVLVVLFFSQSSIRTGGTPFGVRKFFHVVAGFVYFTGLLVSPSLLSFASICVLLAFLLVEWFRRQGTLHVSKLLNEALEPFRDSRDGGELIFTPIALLLGLSLPVWDFCFSPAASAATSPRAWSGVITIALGDSVAALVGRQWGHRFYRWPGTHRTLIGSAASFASQILLWTLLAAFYDWNWVVGLWPLGAGVLAEAYTEQIDNLAIPLLVMSLLPPSV